MACKQREDNVNKMLSQLWEWVEVFWDEKHDATDTLCRALDTDEPLLMLEDDIELCEGFLEKAKAEIEKRPETFIMFYSLWDEEHIPAEEFTWSVTLTQAYYVPANIGKRLSDYLRHDQRSNMKDSRRYDIGINTWLRFEWTKKFVTNPSLVQHLAWTSLINDITHPKHKSPTYKW